MAAPSSADPWQPLTPDAVRETLAATPARWWLSGGAALDRWVGHPIRPRPNIDVSTTTADLKTLIASLPAPLSVWVPGDDGALTAWEDVDQDADIQPVLVFDPEAGAWVLQIDVEDGSPRGWIYRRDPRLQLPWDRAVLDLDGIPTGAPEVQLVWKALRPRPEDELDKDAVLPLLSDEARQFWEKAILRIHPHSTWSIHVRSPLFPAKASWNKKPS